MWSWLSFITGIMIGTPTALIILALIKIQPEKCHCCYNDAITERVINNVKYKLCSECAEYYDNQRVEVTD